MQNMAMRNGTTKTAVLCMNLGGPGTLEEIEPFLRNLFEDPEIIDFPLAFLMRKPLAAWIARRRTPKVAPQYAQIGGGSPQLRWTEAQAAGLAKRLGDGFRCLPCMRYWQPDAPAALRAAIGWGAKRLLLLPLYPQDSDATAGSSERDVERCRERLGIDLPCRRIPAWHDEPLYLQALANRVQTGLEQIPEAVRRDTLLLFSAHSLPMKLVQRGDPYPEQIRATVSGVLGRLPAGLDHVLGFQSRIGPIRWLGPSTVERVQEAAAAGRQSVLVIPISFVSDHIETLSELDIELRHTATAAGVRFFARAPALNDGADFLDALAAVVRRGLAAEGWG
jgi:ferrochelatase